MTRQRRKIGGFVQLWREAVHMLMPLPRGQPPDARARAGLRLTWYQLGVLVGLCAHIGREDTIVRHDDGQGAPMSIADIADVIGCNRQNASKLLRDLERAGAIRFAGSTRGRQVEIMPHIAHRYARRTRRNTTN